MSFKGFEKKLAKALFDCELVLIPETQETFFVFNKKGEFTRLTWTAILSVNISFEMFFDIVKKQQGWM